ncbi:hypothetical protein IMG5_075910 [Ichthyophthirius multifiliis]|uniref:Transmembrane protein n=1 Tax=Ichthyophthirius multifiliis TaxID=5932 RepID=G0R6P3_ICHMU|nr:hypothetical protein IMG5_075910 [Ichthyophthirius multifiliis]EGR26862.1 hypothetical protein IMG5_075910 [Ichthyophthirius multifiliis]|eukprot:XP_004023746.1 hypothetical protein IMG5_075910 [Ichthyophthirius multifiliis]
MIKIFLKIQIELFLFKFQMLYQLLLQINFFYPFQQNFKLKMKNGQRRLNKRLVMQKNLRQYYLQIQHQQIQFQNIYFGKTFMELEAEQYIQNILFSFLMLFQSLYFHLLISKECLKIQKEKNQQKINYQHKKRRINQWKIINLIFQKNIQFYLILCILLFLQSCFTFWYFLVFYRSLIMLYY